MIGKNGGAARHQFLLRAAKKDQVAKQAGHRRSLPGSRRDVKPAS